MKNKEKTMNLTKETQKTYNTQLTNLLDGIADKYDIAPERVEKFRNGLKITKLWPTWLFQDHQRESPPTPNMFFITLQ